MERKVSAGRKKKRGRSSQKKERKLGHLLTEKINPRSRHIDSLPPRKILELINSEDSRVAAAVRKEIPRIARAVTWIENAFDQGGRLIYVGAGTSGRLGVLDASECPPTFGTHPSLVQGIIAGGPSALIRAVEGGEDNHRAAKRAIARRKISRRDVVVGIASSTTTPYVVSALEEAKKRGARTVLMTCNPARQKLPWAQLVIAPLVGAEVVTGSTRMKAGTATKLVLNMLTTTAMIRRGKTYGSLMVDLRATSSKLLDRASRILVSLAGIEYQEAEVILRKAKFELKPALVMAKSKVSYKEAKATLRKTQGKLRPALGPARGKK